MKKWLAALFCCLLMTSAALAEDDLFARVCGMWRWETESPATPLGDGVYFHVDGTCTLYDAVEYDDYHTDLITGMTLHAEGTWTALRNTVLVAVGDEVHTLPVKVMKWPDWEYNEGLRIGEGAYMPTSAKNMAIPLESVIPASILELVHTWYEADVIEDYRELPDVDGRPMSFVLFRSEGKRTLCIFQLHEDDRWNGDSSYTSGIPQIDLPDVTLGVNKGGGSYESRGSLWYDPDKHDFEYPDGPRISVWTSNGETLEERVEYVWQDGAFRLIHYGDNPVCQIDVVEDMLVFYNISDPGITSARHTLNLELWAVDFYALPRKAEDVRIMGEDEPVLPALDAPGIMDAQRFLTKQDVKLRAGTYPVYMGPGKEYGRAADGKASVSTNGWVQVFGEYDGWLLVHYAISAEQYRFGWIAATALARGETIAPLPLTFGDFVTVEIDLSLTDDPLNSRTPLVTIPEWADAGPTGIEYLAQLGGSHALVRTEVDGRIWWGFVPCWPLGHG